MILKKEQNCIMENIIFLFRYKNFAIHGKQIGMSLSTKFFSGEPNTPTDIRLSADIQC